MIGAVGDLVAGRYRLQERIGVGAMGEVWRARDLRLQRDVALKRVRIDATIDAAAEERFRREAVAMAGVSHPNVVRIYDAGTDAGSADWGAQRVGPTAFLVMELLDGPTTTELIDADHVLAVDQVQRIGAGVAHGLAAAHAAGVVHRDIKPSNIMLSRGVPTIVDFGIARLEQAGTGTLTAPQSTIGTAAYMSPEQALGEPIGAPSDIYSLGALIVALATGSPPFGTANALALMRAHIDDVPPRLSELRDDVPPELDDLVAEMLAKDPAQRPSATEVARRLVGGDAPAGLPVTPTAVLPTAASAGPPPAAPMSDSVRDDVTAPLPPSVRSAYPPSVEDRPRRGWLWALIGVVLLAAVVLALFLRPQDTPPPNTPTTGPGTTPVDSPTTSETSEPSPSPTTPGQELTLSETPSPEPTTPAEPDSPTDSTAPIAPLQDAVDAVVAEIAAVEDDDAREELTKVWNRLSPSLKESNAADKIRDLQVTADRLLEERSLTPAEQRAIITTTKVLLERLPR